MNVDSRFPGRLTPSFAHALLSTTDRLHYAVRAIETQAPTSFNPRQYCGINLAMWRLDDGAETSDTTFADVVQGQVICDNGSGTKILLVGFGASASLKNAKRSLTTDTTPWTTANAAGSAQFWLVEKAGADIYAMCDAGVTGLGEYHVSKCPAGNDPTLAASWGNGLECGTPEWMITGLAAIGDSIVAGKPDGLYYYNDQTKRFENVLPFLIDAPHAVNGKGMRSVPNGVLYPTHDGKLYFFDGVSVKDVSPDKGINQPRDAGQARITALATLGDEIYAVRECWQNTTQGLGLKVITRIAGTYADVTSTVIDGNLTTGANVGTYGNAADDAIFVGSSTPLEAICFRTTRTVNAAVQSFATPEYSNGTTGASAPFDSSFTAFTAIRDGSILSVAATSLVNTGYPPAASNAVISWTDKNSFDLSTSTSIAFGGAIGTLVRYWYRLKRVTATGMTASTTIDEVEIVPSRAGIPIAAANDFTHRWRAGGITEVMVAKIKGTNAYEWHSVYNIDTGGGVWAMCVHSGRLGQANGAQNMGQQIILWGRYVRAAITLGPMNDPSRTIVARLAGYSTTKPGSLLDLAPRGTYLTDGEDVNRWRMKKIKGFWVIGDFVQQTDITRIHVQMDEDADIVSTGNIYGAPYYYSVEGLGLNGFKMQAWLEINQGTELPNVICPQFVSVIVDYEYASALYDGIPIAHNTALPSTT